MKDFARQVIPGVVAGVIGSVIVALAVTLYGWFAEGVVVRALGGVTKQDLNSLQAVLNKKDYTLSVSSDEESEGIELWEDADACFITRISAEMVGVDPLIGLYESDGRWQLKGRFYPENREVGHDSQVGVRCIKFELTRASSAEEEAQ